VDVLPRLKLLNDLTGGTPPAVTPVRSFPANGMYLHEPVQGLNLNRLPITRLEPVMPVTVGRVVDGRLAMELPPRVHLGLELADLFCAAI
jgi:hypothetical protein